MKNAIYALALLATLASAPTWAAQSRTAYNVTHVPATLTPNVPARTPDYPTIADDFTADLTAPLVTPKRLEPADKARFVAFRKNYIVTAAIDGHAFRTMNMVVDSEGLAYSTSQQSFRDPAGDMLWVHVTSYAPLIVDFKVVSAAAGATAARDRVAVGDVPVGVKAYALQEGHLSVEIERLADDIDLRAESILRDSRVQLIQSAPGA